MAANVSTSPSPVNATLDWTGFEIEGKVSVRLLNEHFGLYTTHQSARRRVDELGLSGELVTWRSNRTKRPRLDLLLDHDTAAAYIADKPRVRSALAIRSTRKPNVESFLASMMGEGMDRVTDLEAQLAEAKAEIARLRAGGAK